MRNPPDDAADQPGGRRRGHRGSPSGSHRSGSTAGQREAASGGESSVFSPGYDGRREPAPDRDSGSHGRPGSWPGAAAGSAGGKGPVRGFPPAPGQPLPMYPPGQFSAWNRGMGGQGRRGSAPGAPAASGPSAQTGPHSSPGWQGRPESGRPPGSSYYGRDTGGYSMLAVSDPAADVTSTQTWQAVGEGRATGTWTSPFANGEGQHPGDGGPDAADPGALPARSSVSSTGTGPRLAAGSGAADLVLGGPESDHRGPAGSPGPDVAGPPGVQSGSRSAQAGRSGRLAPWSPQAAAARAAAGTDRAGARAAGAATAQAPTVTRDPAERGTGTRDTGTPGPGGGRRGRGTQAPPRRRSGHRYPRSAILLAVVLVVAAGAALYLGSHLISSRAHPSAGPRTTPVASATPTPTPSPTLGPYGHIATRAADPMPLTIAQLYPVRFAAGGALYTRTADRLSKSCGNAVVGSNVQSAISSAGCTQAVRATYLSGTKMGTIGVFNLKTAGGASKAGRAAGASNFVAQLPAKSGPTKKLGHGTGVEEAVFKGHYLILIWAEFTDLRTPKTKAQQASLATFMSQLLQSTANVSLSNRMANGTP
jgi:hypothetical protein